MVIFLILLLFFLLPAGIGAGAHERDRDYDDECMPKRCGDEGPDIRFPFWLKDHQPERCGYGPGFALTCSHNKKTLVDIAFSAWAVVEEIDYSDQSISYEFSGCVPPHEKNQSSITNISPFTQTSSGDSYQVFSCPNQLPVPISSSRYSSMVDDYNYNYYYYSNKFYYHSNKFFYYYNYYGYVPLPCVSRPGHNLYLLESYYTIISQTLLNCTKMYGLQSDPTSGTSSWSQPDCLKCEVRGKYCRLNSSSNNSKKHETECFDRGDCGNGGGCKCGCFCVHSGAMMEDIQPHPVMEQLPGVQYCINSPPPWLEVVVLGFQHYLKTLGTTVLIPSMFVNHMGGSNVEKAKVIQTLLLVSRLNTLMQSLFGTRLPSVIGGSYAFVIPMTSILHAERYHLSSPEPYGDYCTYHKFERTMRGMQGALIVTSCFQMLIGFLGVWRNVVRFLTPLSVVPLMTFTGLGLYYLGFQMCVEIGLPELILMVIISQYLPHYAKAKTKRRVCDRFALLFSVAFVWGYAQILTSSGAYHNASAATQASCRTDRAGLITGAP